MAVGAIRLVVPLGLVAALALAAAKAALVGMAANMTQAYPPQVDPVVRAVLTVRTITPTGRPAARVLERGPVVAAAEAAGRTAQAERLAVRAQAQG